VLKGQCSGGGNLGVFYQLDSPVTQSARAFGQDPFDQNPIGGAGVTNTAGGVGYGGAGHIQLEGEVWTHTAERVLWLNLMIETSCAYRVRATLDRDDAP
jgi:hypothetical protein